MTLPGVFNVQDYGVDVGSGGDDLDAFNGVIAAARTFAGDDRQAQILIPSPPSGSYNVSATVGSTDLNATRISIVGVGGYRYSAPQIRGNGSAPILQGEFTYSQLANLRFDANGGPGLDICVDHAELKDVNLINWTGYAVRLNDPTEYGTPLDGYLCWLTDCEVEAGSETVAGLPVGFALIVNYPLTDSRMSGGLLAGGWANVLINGSGPFRLENVHLDGNPVNNVIALENSTSLVIDGGILEGSMREAVRIGVPNWVSPPGATQRLVLRPGAARGAGSDGSGKWPVLSVTGLSSATHVLDVAVAGSSFASDAHSASYVAELTQVGNAALSGNTWESQFTRDNPVLAVGCSGVEVVGNAGTNGIDAVPATLTGLPVALWCRADDLGSGTVTAWPDASGYARTVTGSGGVTVGTGPAGHKAVAFDGTTGLFTVADATAFDDPWGVSLHVVVNLAAVLHQRLFNKAGQYWLHANDDTPTGGQLEFFVDAGSGLYLGEDGIATAGTWQVLSCFFDGAIQEIRVNGAVPSGWAQNMLLPDVQPITLTTNTLQIGSDGTNFLSGSIAELVVGDGAISNGTRVAIDLYLLAKYGIAPG